MLENYKINRKEADDLVQKYKSFYKKDLVINNVKLSLYNYILSDYDVFQNDPLSRELRGLVITDNEVFLSVPKFFNINEIHETLFNNIKHKTIKKVQNKLDGSLITPLVLNGQVIAKSKASFTSSQAKIAQNIIDTNEDLKFAVLDLYSNKFQPFFELVGVNNKHVVDYSEVYEGNKLVLIMVRNKDGEFIDINKFDYLFADVTESYNYTLEELQSKQKTEKGVEGWVVKFTDNSVIKVKTEEFFELHKIQEESDSYKIVLKRILNEDMDDILSRVQPKRKEELREIMRVVNDYIVNYTVLCFDWSRNVQSRKDFAQKHKTHAFFGVLMKSINLETIEEVEEQVINFVLKKYNKEEKAKTFIDYLQDKE